MADEQEQPMDWEALATQTAQTYGVRPGELKEEVQRALKERLAKGIVEEILKARPFDWKAAGMTSPATF